MNLYKESVPASEWQGLKNCDFPDQVSVRLLARSIRYQNEDVLDIGCGPRAELGKQVMRFRAKSYLGLDISQDAVKTQLQQGNRAILGDATMLGFPDQQFDIVHTRLVLMHLAPPQAVSAIREALRVSRKRAYFIEADWTPFRGEEPVITRFHNLVLATLGKRADLSYGARLEKAVCEASRGVAGIRTRRLSTRIHGPANYGEVIALARRLVGLLSGTPYGSEAISLLDQLQDQEAREECEIFTPVDFVAVEVLLER